MNTRMQNYGELIKVGLSEQDADNIQRISRGLHRLDEYACNVGYEEGSRQDKRETKLEEKGKGIAQQYGYLFYHQSDPRGWSVYLVKPELLGSYDIQAVYSKGIAVCSQ